MKTIYTPFSSIPHLSKLDIDYSTGVEDFSEFTPYPASLESVIASAKQRAEFEIDRNTLVVVLKDQYTALHASSDQMALIDQLSANNTFTITTAHQPCLFLGPLYMVYKIISTIKLAQAANAFDSSRTYIPVFVIGGEDHDFEEVNHFHIFNQKLVWNTDQHGAVGRFNTAGITDVISSIAELVKNDSRGAELIELLTDSYHNVNHYAGAFQKLLNHLFGTYGILFLNMDDVRLKRIFIPELLKELYDFNALRLIEPVQQQMIDRGYKAATYLRPVNFFYFHDGQRQRIDVENDRFHIHDTTLYFTKEELAEEIKQHPDRFSPNVNLRPLFQEKILPNVAYIGGGGEIAYWLERKVHFASNSIHYPVLVRRDSVIWVDKITVGKLNKLGLKVTDIFQGVDEAISKYLSQVTSIELSFNDELASGNKLFEEMINKAVEIDSTLRGPFEAEHIKFQKSIEHLEQRLVRAQKHQHETAVNQIRSIYSKLFPDNKLQERHDNFIPFWLKMGKDYFSTLLLELDPLRSELKIILEEG